LLAHERQAQLDQVQRCEHVAQEHRLDELERRLLERVHVAGADVAAVVDQHVDATEVLHRGLDRGRPVGALGEVELDDQRVDAERLHLGGGLLAAPGQRLRGLLLDGRRVLEVVARAHGARGDDDVEAAPRELDRAGTADSPAGAGHEGYFSAHAAV